MTEETHNIKQYQKLKNKIELKYRKQAQFMRKELGISNIDDAIEFMKRWLPTQTFNEGVMAGETASVLLTCAILGQSIEPDENQEISFSKATVGVDLYYALKDAELW